MAIPMKNMQTPSPLVKMTILGLSMLLLWGELQNVEAGCSRFGHSCFGAHGKRAEASAPASLNDILIPSGDMPIYAGGYPQPVRADFYPSYIPALNNNRISPYLIDWLLSAHRNEMRQPTSMSKEDSVLAERRK